MNRPDISRLGKNSSAFFKIGLIVSLCTVIFAFNWTTYDRPVLTSFEDEEPKEMILEVIPRTKEEKKPLPPPPKVEASTNIEDIEEPEFIEEPEPELVEAELTADDIPEKEMELPPAPVVQKEKVTPPSIPDEPEAIAPKIWKVVEEMPRFNKCEAETDKKLRKQCAQKAMLEFMYKKIKYPRMAVENGIKGTVVIRFVVDEKGRIIEPHIVRDIGGGCGKEALRVVKTMPNWIPGHQQGKPVKVQFNLPVKFTLQ